MKKISIAVTALLSLGAAAFAQALAPADLDKGVRYLEKTRDGVVSAVKGLSDEQMKFKAGPDRWSVAECLEHIATAEDYIMQAAAGISKAPAAPAGRDTAKIDGMVMAMVPDRSHKAEAPPPLVPKARWTPAEALDHFVQARAKTIEFMKTTQGLRDHVADSPLGQPLDGFEWLLFIAAHSERHTKQILEVKADPNFPK